MNKPLKKIIAREGLIIIACGAVFFVAAPNGFGFTCAAVLAYPTYLLIRFIVWAVKTLKER